MLGWDSAWHDLIAFGAALLGGAVNGIAGGGTNLTFPTLLWLGIPPVVANATNATALFPSSIGGAWGFRHEIRKSPKWWLWLAVPSLIGGAVGGWLLIHTPPQFFRALAPWLVLGSTALLALEPIFRRQIHGGPDRKGSHTWLWIAMVVQFFISLYGGYFGAGIGILILVSLGLLGMSDIHQANGLKNLFSIGIKGVAVIYFISAGAIAWRAALVMAVAALLGGWAAAALGRHVRQNTMRWAIIVIGIGMAGIMFVRL